MMATATALLLGATALALVRPTPPAVVRLRVLGDRPDRSRISLPATPTRRWGLLVTGICGAAGGAAWSNLRFGVAAPAVPAMAGAVAAVTAALVLSGTAADRSRRRAAAALLESVGTLAADLRAGQQPADAVAAPGAGLAGTYRPVAAVWLVSESSGASVATVLDRVEHDLRAREAQRREVAAQLAGARATATLLAVLPVLGIALGAAMGAHPVAVLLGQTRGHLALLAGVSLEAAGVLWTTRIVAAAQGTP